MKQEKLNFEKKKKKKKKSQKENGKTKQKWGVQGKKTWE